MDDPRERGFIIDLDRSTCLRHTGGDHAEFVAIVIGPTGSEHAAIIDMNITDTRRFDITCPTAPHEQLGPLPDEIAHRLRPP